MCVKIPIFLQATFHTLFSNIQSDLSFYFCGNSLRQNYRNTCAQIENYGYNTIFDYCSNVSLNNLSGGQQQRVAIARALVSKPAIILADEPTGNLDSRTSSDVLGLLKMTSQKFHQTIVMITHNNEIAQLADRIIRIEDGRISE